MDNMTLAREAVEKIIKEKNLKPTSMEIEESIKKVFEVLEKIDNDK